MASADETRTTLGDILELANLIEGQTKHLGRDQFLEDRNIQDATAFRLLAIGEAAKSLAPEVTARHPDLPWPKIVGMRNFLAHEYFTIDPVVLWKTIKESIPPLAMACRAELERSPP